MRFRSSGERRSSGDCSSISIDIRDSAASGRGFVPCSWDKNRVVTLVDLVALFGQLRLSSGMISGSILPLRCVVHLGPVARKVYSKNVETDVAQGL